MNIHRSPPSADDTGIARTHLINAIHYRRGVHLSRLNFTMLNIY